VSGGGRKSRGEELTKNRMLLEPLGPLTKMEGNSDHHSEETSFYFCSIGRGRETREERKAIFLPRFDQHDGRIDKKCPFHKLKKHIGRYYNSITEPLCMNEISD